MRNWLNKNLTRRLIAPVIAIALVLSFTTYELVKPDYARGAAVAPTATPLDDNSVSALLSLDQAMEIVSSESGKSFDPVIVDIMRRRYVELERMAVRAGAGKEKVKLSMDVKIERGSAFFC